MRGNKSFLPFLLIGIIAVSIAVTAMFYIGNFAFANGVTGGFQGPTTGVSGVKDDCGNYFFLGSNPLNVCGSTYSASGVLYTDSLTWTWPSTSVTNPEVKVELCGLSIYLLYGCISESVPYSISAPQQICSTNSGSTLSSTPCTPIRYVTQNSSGYYDNTGEIVTYQFTVEIKASTISDPNIIINGLSFINQIGVQHWLSAFDPVNDTWQGYVAQYPLFLVISQCQESNQKYTLSQCGGASCATNYVINPESQGSQAAMYNNPQIAGGWNSLCCSISNNCAGLNSTVSSSGAPSQYITQGPVYFPEELSSFGAYGCGNGNTGSCYPDIALTFEMYTLLIGSYFAGSTNPDQTKYIQTPPGAGCGPLCSTVNAIVDVGKFFAAGITNLYVLIGIVIIAAIAGMTITFTVRGKNR